MCDLLIPKSLSLLTDGFTDDPCCCCCCREMLLVSVEVPEGPEASTAAAPAAVVGKFLGLLTVAVVVTQLF